MHYPPDDVPTFDYVYPEDETLADYLRMTQVERTARRSDRPIVDVDVVWDRLGDFA